MAIGLLCFLLSSLAIRYPFEICFISPSIKMTPHITFILQGTLTYPLSIERKNYVRFTVSLKITLFSFERCLPTDKKKNP